MKTSKLLNTYIISLSIEFWCIYILYLKYTETTKTPIIWIITIFFIDARCILSTNNELEFNWSLSHDIFGIPWSIIFAPKKKQYKINLDEVSQRHILLIIDYADHSRF